MYVQYAIRNVQTGNFVRDTSDDGTQTVYISGYEETDCNGNFATFDNKFQARAFLNKKVKFSNRVCYFEVVKLYVVTPYYTRCIRRAKGEGHESLYTLVKN